MNQLAAMSGFWHAAWFYRDLNEYCAVIDEFVRRGIALGEPVLVAVPRAQLQSLRTPAAGQRVTIDAMEGLGRNPARIIPALREFIDNNRGQRIWFVGESAWPSRSVAELREVARHEALINVAFAADEISILCPYSTAHLSAEVIADAHGIHPLAIADGKELQNQDYLGFGDIPASVGTPLLVPANAQVLAYRDDLREMRAAVAAFALGAGLSRARGTDLVIAASEVAANTLRHTGSGGVMHMWATADEALCQLDDFGFIADPLAGYRRPAADQQGGHGLWVVNQVCDLAEIRTSQGGTTVRLHMCRS